MIRIAIKSKEYLIVKKEIEKIMNQEDLQYLIEEYHKEHTYDIYILEIKEKEELQFISSIQRQIDTLIYIIGKKDFDLANECIRLNVHLYLVNDNIETEIQNHQKDILYHIQERYQYYIYQRHGINSQIRLSQIYYVESLRHQIIIHSINGDFVERKNLSSFLNKISSNQFVQIHKSFVVNKQQIQQISAQEIILKNNINLPIGRAYKKLLTMK